MHTNRVSKFLIAASVLLSTAGLAAPPAQYAVPDFYSAALLQRPYQAAPAPLALRAGGGVAPVSTAGDVITNTSRAYPPSCLGNLVQFGLWQNDPNGLQAQITLYGDPLGSSSEQAYSEVDTVTVFRVPCSGGKSALLVEIDRPAAHDHDRNLYPIFPQLTVQSTAPCAAPGCPIFVPRLAADPNTYFSDTYSYSPFYDSNVYAFENLFGATGDYNGAFDVFVDNLNTNDPNEHAVFHVPAYDASLYPAASQPLPITGYMTGNWYDPNHNHEGIQTEIGEIEGTTTRYLVVAWYTYNSSGTPYWIFGAAGFTAGAQSVTITQMAYSSNGGFAGNFGAAADQALWGTLTAQFTDCNTLHFSYQSTAGLPAGVPTGSGTRNWTRASQMNGLACQ